MTGTLCLGGLAFVAYTYFGYPLLLVVWRFFRRRTDSPAEGTLIPVTVVIAAHNEEHYIERALRSFLSSDYPHELLEIVVISDASTDKTDDVVQGCLGGRGQFLRCPERGGKVRALAAGIPLVRTDVMILADASGQVESQAVRRLVRHFGAPDVGSVVGRKSILSTDGSVAPGDGLYWRYEANLRHLESDTGSSWSGCEGALFAIRTPLLHLDLKNDIAEDTAACFHLCAQGFRNVYDPTARVFEAASRDAVNEFRRKTRVVTRNIRALKAYWFLLDPFRYPAFFVQNISHRLFRWLVPFALLVAWGAGAASLSMRTVFWVQTAFYIAAMVGYFLDSTFHVRRIPRLLSVPLYFCTVNLAVFCAWFRLFENFQVWQPPTREPADSST